MRKYYSLLTFEESKLETFWNMIWHDSINVIVIIEGSEDHEAVNIQILKILLIFSFSFRLRLKFT